MTAKLSWVGRKLFFPLFLSGWMVSCSPLNPFGLAQEYLDIAKLEEISNQRTVNVQGIVVNVAPFLEGGAYQIQDKTGRVWVKTDRQLPRKGTVLSIRGEVAFEPIFIGPEKLGESYLVETTAPNPQATASNDGPDTSVPAEETPTAIAPTENTTDIAVIQETTTEQTEPTGTTEATEVTAEVAEEVTATETPVSPVSSDTAANLMPPTSSSDNSSTRIPVANPEAPRPIADSASPQPPSQTKPNFDNQFLPHKRLSK
ncbi:MULTISPECIES: hypothetical protein [unclassified Synechocystis]|uniref:hypothetical protein n=1 Tax=unclassified Synechocystis TaxID=2640012 RepID=UPI0004227619|nr:MULTISPECIES: hypothetical protein [unclassified Synechocystis]AIE72690.1 hypothetical protein D082_01610 [Synechocystis sp. PCC 6714]